MKRWNVPVAVFFVVCLLSGCKNSEIQADPYLQDLERALTLKAQVSQCYLETLAAAKAYTEEPSEEALQNAKDICLLSVDAITGLATIESELTPGQRESMSDLGIDPSDYMTPFLMQTYDRGTRLQTLTDVLHYLNQAPESDDILAFTTYINISFEELSWQIDLIGINYLLAEVPVSQLEDFKNSFLANLSAFAGGPIQWETDRAILDEKSETVFDEIENLIGEHAKQIGELYASALDEKKGLGLELEAAGLPADEAAGLERRAEQFLEEGQPPAG